MIPLAASPLDAGSEVLPTLCHIIINCYPVHGVVMRLFYLHIRGVDCGVALSNTAWHAWNDGCAACMHVRGVAVGLGVAPDCVCAVGALVPC